MTKLINLTPEAFVEVFMLCLSWQWQPISLLHTYTTVDKVLKILLGLGCVNEGQVKMLQDRRLGATHQRALRHSIEVLHCNSNATVSKKKGTELSMLAMEILGQTRSLCIHIPSWDAVTLPRLVRDQRIHLTYLGAAQAAGLTEKYTPWVTREAFKAEEHRRDEMFQNERASAAAARAYRESLTDDEWAGRARGKPSTGPRCTLSKLW